MKCIFDWEKDPLYKAILIRKLSNQEILVGIYHHYYPKTADYNGINYYSYSIFTNHFKDDFNSALFIEQARRFTSLNEVKYCVDNLLYQVGYKTIPSHLKTLL